MRHQITRLMMYNTLRYVEKIRQKKSKILIKWTR